MDLADEEPELTHLAMGRLLSLEKGWKKPRLALRGSTSGKEAEGLGEGWE